mmetsp:Transcript_58520/g.104052  ORF Transcript_58520/g.104052 Transcript_58520/m.104052 type:complete len:366 (+) Transcript_58520:136-1233(+)|eukprot:CAMPEP_0197659768 /NCGR_PEP_ID=MMETSP1338-20131121/48997_1 /TAXON_ID=43686 ORGANISM="Pelagodinium beii, Strain RCC1491" /NCGR_SAMPLE_ID=MMETSP1338 /ASSEMBLY_ACC=CAM_ASM_000754 /LENGTH=365 /DNA_ID=CAMNT_0043236855 /DNA_START=115 /DNA_END=1212 /DNA_ORIENTATION=+
MASCRPGAMLVKRLSESAKLPVRGSIDAAGFDLAAAEPNTVPAGGKAIVKTGLSVAVPQGTYARIAPRSGLAVKQMIATGAGVVDFDYRGEVGVVLFNHGAQDFQVAPGDRVAQLILESVCMADCTEVESLDETQRGSGGFGSTGVNTSVQGQTAHVPAAEPEKADVMQVKRLSPNAVLPVRGSADAAGFDLSAAMEVVVPAGGKAIIKTGLSIAIPRNTYARIAPRSGLAVKKMIQVGAGVVDYDYRGEVGVVLFNHGKEDFSVAQGDRVAQLVLERISMASCVEVESLEETARGAGGFGSTGVAEKVPEAMSSKKRPRNTEEELDALKAEMHSFKSEAAEAKKLKAEVQELKDQVANLVRAGA